MLIAYSIIATILLVVSLFFLYRMVRIIMILEDDFSDAIDSLDRLKESTDSLLKMQMFFDNKEVKASVNGMLEDLKMARMDLNAIIRKFIDRSRNKYVMEIVEEEDVRALPREIREKMMASQNRGRLSSGDFGENY
jgi:hypothetical protein